MARREITGYLQSVDPLLMQPEYPVFPEGVRIGRDAESCEIILSREFVSRRHCALGLQAEGVVIEDTGSTNGVFVNGRRVARHPLQEGDIISLGKESGRHFVFSRTSSGGVREIALPPQALYRIGRSLNADIPLLADPTVSIAHTFIRMESGRVVVEDQNSANGTFVNGVAIRRQAVGPQDRVSIGSATLFFSASPGGLRVTVQDTRNQVDLRGLGLTRSHKGRTILRGVSLAVRPGEFVGMLGPSGAGKSTLLTALCGFQPAHSGDVLIGGSSLYGAYDMHRHTIGYVPQDDIIHRDLTVEKSLVYTAQLRLPRDNTPDQIAQNVNSVIETLGLDHVRNNPVSRLSGGQRKRVSVGCELLTRPGILFLDEPTSGLDPSTEEKLMRHFSQMAGQGQTVIVTTHILYNLDLLDLVIIMARGRMVYFGPVAQLCPFFSTPERAVERPLDVFDVLEPDTQGDASLLEKRAEFFEKKYRESPLYQEFVVDRGAGTGTHERPTELATPSGTATGQPARAIAPQKPPRRLARMLGALFDLRQFGILLRRAFDLKFSALGRLLVPMLTPVILAVLTGTIAMEDMAKKEEEQARFERENGRLIGMLEKADPPMDIVALKFKGIANFPLPLSAPLIMIMTGVFLGTLSACLEISGERSIYLRERSVNLRIHTYLLAKLPFLFLLALAQAFVYTLLAAVLIGIPAGQILGIMVTIAAVAWASCMVGLFISSLDPSTGQNSVVLAVVAVLPQLVLAGAQGPAFYHGMSAPMKVLAGILPARWGFEMLLNVLYETPEWAREYITGDGAGQMGFRFGRSVLVTNMAALGAVSLGFFAATCLSLKRYDKL